MISPESSEYVPIRHRPGDAMPAAFSRERRQQNRPASRKFHSVRRVSGQKGTLARLINRKPIFRSLKNAVNIYTAYQSRILPRLAARRPPLQNPDRKSVVKGKWASVRVDLGRRRIVKKNKNKNTK